MVSYSSLLGIALELPVADNDAEPFSLALQEAPTGSVVWARWVRQLQWTAPVESVLQTTLPSRDCSAALHPWSVPTPGPKT